jgi:mRNA interferase MazF
VTPRRGELWWCETPEIGIRPVVVLSRNEAIEGRRKTIVAPCTTTLRGLASEVLLEPEEDPVPHPTAVNLDAVQDVPVVLLLDRLGTLSEARMGDLCEALRVAIDC